MSTPGDGVLRKQRNVKSLTALPAAALDEPGAPALMLNARPGPLGIGSFATEEALSSRQGKRAPNVGSRRSSRPMWRATRG